MNTIATTKKVWIKPYLSEKRAELIWALSQQGYSENEIGSIFNLSKQRINAINKQRPQGWKSPWIKLK